MASYNAVVVFHSLSIYLIFYIFSLAYAGLSFQFETFQDYIPNGKIVPSPCPGGGIWQGVGHQAIGGAGYRNPFGEALKTNSFVSMT